MKKNNILAIAAISAAVLGLAVSCSAEQDDIIEGQNNEQTVIPATSNPSEISAAVSEELTKVALGDAGVGNGLTMTWETDDQLTVIGTTTEKFTLSSGQGTASAKFSGTPVEGDSFTILYPGTKYATVEAINARSYTSQVQNGNGSTAHLEWNAKIAGVNDYSTLQFYSNDKLSQNGALKFHLQLPSGFTKVYKVALKAPASIFSTTNGGGSTTDELVLSLKTGVEDGITLGSDNVLTAFMMVSWNNNVIAEGTVLTVEVWGDQEEPWVKTKAVGEGGFTIAGGKVTTVTLNNASWEEPLFWGGSGTSADPYLIKTAYNLGNVKTVMDENPTAGLYFRMIDDIDLENAVWSQVNQANPHTPYTIHFDGNGHSISNFSIAANSMGLSSFFGEISGEVSGLTFNNGTIATGGSNGSAGILAGIANGLTVTNVDANDVDITINGNPGETTGVGGLVGYAIGSTFTNCDLDGCDIDLNGKNAENVGGLVGRLRDEVSSIINCSVSNATISARYCSGGLVGKLACTTGPVNIKSNGISSVTLSYRDAHDYTNAGVGGLIGLVQASAGVEVNIGEVAAPNTVTGISIDNAQPYAGGLVGQIKTCIPTIAGNTVSGSTVSSTGNGAGGVVGYIAVEGVSISSCMFLKADDVASVTGKAGVGGIVGRSVTTTVSNCDAEGAITATGTWADSGETYSFAGGIVGRSEKSTVQDCTFNNGSVTGSNRTGGIAGASLSGAGSFSGCTVGSDATINGGTFTGGILGRNHNSGTAISNCTVQANLSCSGQQTGGIIGEIPTNTTITGCTVSSTFTASKKDSYIDLGGIVGDVTGGTAAITSCAATMTMTHTAASGAMGIGGIIGTVNSGTATISLCKTAGSLTVSRSANGYAEVGGLLGRINTTGTVKAEKSVSSLAITGGNTQATGGLVGNVANGATNIDQCCFSGSVTSPGTQSGGMIGHIAASKTATVSNSYMSGTVRVTAGGYSGAFCGYCEGNINLSNSYANGSVKVGTQGSNGNGGLIGGFNSSTSSTISGNLCWLSSFDCSAVTDTGVTIGAIVGRTISGVSLSDNYRVNALNFSTGNGYVLTNDAAGKDGAEVASGITCQAQATALGWSSEIWKLDNADGFPTLKNLPE